ncbi:MAG: polysaccharide deacetylase family protein [Pirellulales bacterium]|nr:polysaccharide deacetylase family protein [Pirellulales bacterium]
MAMRPPIVIFYHQLVERPRRDHYFLTNALTPEQFRRSMEQLRAGWHVLSMDEMCRIWQGDRRWPPRSVVVTFDDGFKNNLWAAQILHELGLSATFFVLAGVIETDFVPWYLRFAHALSTRRRDACDGRLGAVDFRNRLESRRWSRAAKNTLLSLPPAERDAALDELTAALDCPPWDRADRDLQYFTGADLREMRRLGQTIGCHSWSHDNLARCNADERQHEVVASGEALSRHLGEPVTVFSYPDGRYNDAVVELASRHYQLAFAANPHVSAADAWRYPRRHAGSELAPILAPWFPLRRRAVGWIKWTLGER